MGIKLDKLLWGLTLIFIGVPFIFVNFIFFIICLGLGSILVFLDFMEDEDSKRPVIEHTLENKPIQKPQNEYSTQTQKINTQYQKHEEKPQKNSETTSFTQKQYTKEKINTNIPDNKYEFYLRPEIIKKEYNNDEKPYLKDYYEFVYIISNIGSFGEGIYKIGMTTTTVKKRIKSLETSVPFNFDINIIIKCYYASETENELHRKFHAKRVNKEKKKEFFNLTINDLRHIYKEYEEDIVFYNEYPFANEFRKTFGNKAIIELKPYQKIKEK